MKDKSISDFLDILQQAYNEKDNLLRNNFSRSLSFQDAMFDRWERAKNLGFGDGSSIYNSAAVFGNVSVGEKTWIGLNVLLDGSGGIIKIGHTCSIASGVHIYTHDSIAWALSSGQYGYQKGMVTIGNSTYIGSQSVISAGVNIGTQSVIGANSYVNTNVPELSIYAGSPAKKIGHVEFNDNKPILVFDSGKVHVLVK